MDTGTGGNMAAVPPAGGTNWGDVIGMASQSALQWYSTVTQKPVQSGRPGSLMGNVFGADLGSGSGTTIGVAASPIASLLVVAVIVVGVVLIIKR
jgi:hypothetical protein